MLLTGLAFGCSKSDDSIPTDSGNEVPVNPVTPSYRNVTLASDKAVYNPGDEVTFTINTTPLPSAAKVRYKYLDSVIGEGTVPGAKWKWQTPDDDFKGYIVEVYSEEAGAETIYATIGVDVSSNWTKFPRYGFLSKYPELGDQQAEAVISKLNRYHINGLQFYDWHNKHHQPLPIVNGEPATSWKDIFNRDIYLNTIKQYIASAHSHNMKAMFYNLVYGTWGSGEADGVNEEWYIFTDNSHTNKDYHPLPSPPFLSNIYLTDPSNSGWQEYLSAENQKVYENLDFDGFHMDQLGDRGTRYTYSGNSINLAETYKPFIDAMKTENTDKNLVMNAVNQYGQQGIAQAAVDFLYTEVWSPNDDYDDLANIIKTNNSYSNNTKNTVLAAYMNYDLSGKASYFNTPAVLLTDAVIFAFGGSHLELGEHMLVTEYFPNSSLGMKTDLSTALVDYYDFLVAYQNLLRDGGTFNEIAVSSLDRKLPLNQWPSGQGTVAAIGKKVGNNQVIHFINFTAAKNSNWRDNDGIQGVPATVKDAELSISINQPVRKVWVASPDIIGGASRSLNFQQSGSELTFTLPELKYWSMIVIEFE